MPRPTYFDICTEMINYLKQLEDLAAENPEEAKRIARQSLIESGVLNKDGSPKENIVTEPHVGNLDDLAKYYEEYNKNDKKIVKQRKKGN